MMVAFLAQLDHWIFLVALALLCLPGAWLVWLDVQHVRLRRTGMAEEAALLRRPLPAEAELPHVLVQIPTYNEPHVVGRVLQAAAALDWPRDKLHLQILDDSTDETATIAGAAVAALQAQGIDAAVLHRAERVDFKAGALRDGLSRSDHQYVAVFDADFLPAPDFLRLCLRALLADPNLAFVQARWTWLNAGENALTRAQQRLLDGHFAVEQTAKSWSGHVLNFNGSCGVWRRAAIDDAGGWTADTLTEDMDISFRAQLRGWRARFLFGVAVPGELPATIEAWRTQQYRWAKGLGQVARKLLLPVWRSRLPLAAKLTVTLNLSGCVFGTLLAVVLATGALDLALAGGPTPAAVALVVFALLQGIGGGLAQMLLAQRLLYGTDPWSEIPRIAAGISFYVYAQLAVMDGVLGGLRGRHSAFVRTPKKGAGHNGHAEPAAPGPRAPGRD
jgi:cellulose synthase/poly-beta-1,6-N-acetylglucosamine synthase-like glycosyltransferase